MPDAAPVTMAVLPEMSMMRGLLRKRFGNLARHDDRRNGSTSGHLSPLKKFSCIPLRFARSVLWS
jgi:hypothetical protein